MKSLPREVLKPWGSELWLAHTDRYAGKILRVRAGCRLSVQFHEEKDETSYVLSGRVIVSQGDSADQLTARELGPGASWRIRPRVVHTLEAVEDAEIIEVSTPELEDVVRLEDRYGRAPGRRLAPEMSETPYDRIGRGYANTRRADPRIAGRIEEVLGDARSVVNVGAGAGSYEPPDRDVTAVEPSAEMIAQRPPGAAPVVQASAESLPFGDDSFDAALAVLTTHHWPNLNAGLGEMLRVARQRVMIVAFDSEALEDLWITADYFPEMLGLKRPSGANSSYLARVLPAATSSPLLVPRDCTDHFFAALWARPELLFDEGIVRPMWAWQGISEESRRAGRKRLAADLESGAWDRRYGYLRELDELDVGLRLVVSELQP
jgi:SAM-dependent methyltransferase